MVYHCTTNLKYVKLERTLLRNCTLGVVIVESTSRAVIQTIISNTSALPWLQVSQLNKSI